MPEQIPEDDWADQDLLTRSEAAERLRTEISKTEAEMAGLAVDDPARARHEARIVALRGAIEDLATR